MADNFTVNATETTGDTFAADEISSVKYQRMKLIVGADGTNDGDVCTGNPMPISDAGGAVSVDDNGGSLTVDGTVATTGFAAAQTGYAYDSATQCTLKRSSTVEAGAGANEILAAVAAKKFRVLALSLVALNTTANGVYLYNGDNELFGTAAAPIPLDLDAGGGPQQIVLPWNPGGWFQTDTVNEALSINLANATGVLVCVTYIEVA